MPHNEPAVFIDVDVDRVTALRDQFLRDARLGPEHGMACERVFAVLTWGYAASTWLAYALNAHPDLFCVHAAYGPWQTMAEAKQLDGVRYLKVLAREGYGHTAVGDVHGLTRDDVPRCRAVYGPSFRCAITVREPLARLRSGFGHFLRDPGYRAGIDATAAYWLERGVVLPADSYTNRLQIVGIGLLNAIESEWGVTSIWRSEDLTQRPEKLCEFIAELTNDEVAADPAWASAIIAKPRINRHGGDVIEFDDWHYDAIRKIVTPRAWDLYAELGYPRPDFL